MQGIPPILSLIMEDLNITHGQAGLLMSMFSLPGIFLVIPLSFIYLKIGIKRIGLFSILLALAGSLLIAFAGNFPLILLGRALIGIGAVALPVVGVQTITQWFAGNRLGLAMGIYATIMPISMIIILTTFGSIAVRWGWKSTVFITIIISMLALIAFALFFREPPKDIKIRKERQGINFSLLFQMGWPIWLLAICWGLISFNISSVFTFTPDFVYQNGIDLRIAGSITSIPLFCSLFISPLFGFLLDRIQFKVIFLLVGAIAGSILVFLLPLNVNQVVLFMVLIGIITAPFPVTVFILAPRLVKPNMVPMSFALVAAFSYIGGFIGPSFTGFIRDLTGTYLYSYWLISLLFIVMAIFSARLFALSITGTKRLNL